MSTDFLQVSTNDFTGSPQLAADLPTGSLQLAANLPAGSQQLTAGLLTISSHGRQRWRKQAEPVPEPIMQDSDETTTMPLKPVFVSAVSPEPVAAPSAFPGPIYASAVPGSGRTAPSEFQTSRTGEVFTTSSKFLNPWSRNYCYSF